MKKSILSICFLFAAVTFVSAQQGQGGGANAQERQAQMKQALKDSLSLTDAQVQTVLDVQRELRPKMMELRNASEADRPAKMKEINDEMSKKLAEALKDEALAKKVTEYNARHRGGRGGGGNRPQGQANN
jgi:hypothetical protein